MPAMNDQKFAEFFAVMAGIFGHKWTSQYGENPESISARVWNDGLESLNLKQIAEAIRYYKNQSLTSFWPPSLPEFRAQALRIPSISNVRHELRTNKLSRFAGLVWNFIDGYAYKSASQVQADKMLNEAYELAIEAIMAGEPLPEHVAEIEHAKPDPVVLTPEQIAERKVSFEKTRAEINKLFGETA